jgi:hypothetical protein
LSIPGAGLVAAALLSIPPAAQAASVTPVFVPGNPSCAALGYAFGFKVDPPNTGTYSIDGINTVTVTTDGVSFDWSSTLGMDAVISKGGPNANVYVYDPPSEATSDTDLHSPINPNNSQPFGLSHIDVCFDYEVQVTKDAHTSFTRTYLWDLDKSVAPELWTLFTGDSGTSLNTLGVSRTGFTDSAWAGAGTISIYNPSLRRTWKWEIHQSTDQAAHDDDPVHHLDSGPDRGPEGQPAAAQAVPRAGRAARHVQQRLIGPGHCSE